MAFQELLRVRSVKHLEQEEFDGGVRHRGFPACVDCCLQDREQLRGLRQAQDHATWVQGFRESMNRARSVEPRAVLVDPPGSEGAESTKGIPRTATRCFSPNATERSTKNIARAEPPMETVSLEPFDWSLEYKHCTTDASAMSLPDS